MSTRILRSLLLALAILSPAFPASAQEIPELARPSTLSGAETSARFFGGVTADNGKTFSNSIDPEKPVDITAKILVEESHINSTGNLYIVARLDEQFFYLDSSGQYLPWNMQLATLEPAIAQKILNPAETLDVLNDASLKAAVNRMMTVNVWPGYDTTAMPGELYFSGTPIRVLGPETPGTTPFQELYEQGVDIFLGTIKPIISVQSAPGQTEHFFDSADGPMCFTGNEFSMHTRDGESESLLIFLQGGGFCSPDNCNNAVEDGIPFIPFGMLDPGNNQNPVADHDVGYVPYCDGSAMMGNNDVDSNGDGINDRFFRGLQNLSASLDVIKQHYPDPDQIVLAGNSAGGFAVHVALPLVRKLYPEVMINLINDSGNGILRPGGMDTLISYWNAGRFFPPACSECIGADGNLTGYHAYQLYQDPDVRMAYISSRQDATISAGLPGGGPSLEEQLLEAAAELKFAFPERFNSLIAEGDAHTFLIRRYDSEIGGISVSEWVSDMISGSSEWESKMD